MHVFIGDPSGGEARGGGLEQQPELDDVLHVAHRDRSDYVPASRNGAEESLLAQAQQRGPNGRFSETIARSQLGFSDLAAGLQTAGDDIPFDSLKGDPVQRWPRGLRRAARHLYQLDWHRGDYRMGVKRVQGMIT